MPRYAVTSNGRLYGGYDVPTIEDALFWHVPYGGGPEATEDPARNRGGFWLKDMVQVYLIHSDALFEELKDDIFVDGGIECLNWQQPKDYELVGTYRWPGIHDDEI